MKTFLINLEIKSKFYFRKLEPFENDLDNITNKIKSLIVAHWNQFRVSFSTY